MCLDLNKRSCYGSGVASWLVRSPPDGAVLVQALAEDIVLCSWARQFTLTSSTQVYKWVPANLMVGVPSNGSRDTCAPSCFNVHTTEAGHKRRPHAQATWLVCRLYLLPVRVPQGLLSVSIISLISVRMISLRYIYRNWLYYRFLFKQ